MNLPRRRAKTAASLGLLFLFGCPPAPQEATAPASISRIESDIALPLCVAACASDCGFNLSVITGRDLGQLKYRSPMRGERKVARFLHSFVTLLDSSGIQIDLVACVSVPHDSIGGFFRLAQPISKDPRRSDCAAIEAVAPSGMKAFLVENRGRIWIVLSDDTIRWAARHCAEFNDDTNQCVDMHGRAEEVVRRLAERNIETAAMLDVAVDHAGFVPLTRGVAIVSLKPTGDCYLGFVVPRRGHDYSEIGDVGSKLTPQVRLLCGQPVWTLAELTAADQLLQDLLEELDLKGIQAGELTFANPGCKETCRDWWPKRDQSQPIPDFWGNAVRWVIDAERGAGLHSAGPDAVFGTHDDRRVQAGP